MTLFPRRRNFDPKKEDIMVRDLVGILLWFFLVSLSIELALRWPAKTAASPTLSGHAYRDQPAIDNVAPESMIRRAMPPQYLFSYFKVTAANYDPKLGSGEESAKLNADDENFHESTKSEREDNRIASYPTEMNKVMKTQSVKSPGKKILDEKFNSLHLSDAVIPLSSLEDNVSSVSDLKQMQLKKSMQSASNPLNKRGKREKKNDVKHVLKVTYDFIHPRIMTPVAAFVRTHKRDSDFQSQSESLQIEPRQFDHETPSLNFNYNDVKFHETDHAPFHKRTEEAATDIAQPPPAENNTTTDNSTGATTAIQSPATTPGTPSNSSGTGESVSSASEVLNKTTTVDKGKSASVKDGKGTPRSSDPETDALHMTTVTFDPSAIVTIPPGQFDTMDFDVPGEPLTPEDYQQAALAQDEPIDTSRQVDPTTTAEQFEGDIKLVEDDKPINKTALQGLPSFRSGIVSSERLWPNGNVPYVLSSTFRPEERSIIAKAIKTLHDLSCVHLVPHTNERDYIHILKGDGCTSNIGRVGGSQALSLGPGCIKAGVVMHELMHALGFWHEQSRFDRDRYININWDNIQKGKGYNFQKYDFKGLQHVGTQYDFESLMHYSPYAFAKNRSVPTVEPKEGQHEVGQRRGLSLNDLHRLMELYPCPNATSPANFPNVHLPTATLPPPVPGLCLDSDKHCAKWAQEGQCSENPAWMMLHCRQSCNRCAESKCVDLNDKCALWKADGQCEANAPYMHLYCSKSCQLCSGTETTSGDCSNSNKKCGLWASQGDCVRYPGYMNRYCRQSCLQC